VSHKVTDLNPVHVTFSMAMAHALQATAALTSRHSPRPNAAGCRPATPSSRGRSGAVLAIKRRHKMNINDRAATVTLASESAAAEVEEDDDDGPPELPEYDVVMLGPLESSACVMGVGGWLDTTYNTANTYVAAVGPGRYCSPRHRSPTRILSTRFLS